MDDYDQNSRSIDVTFDETDPAADIAEARRQNRVGRFMLHRRTIYYYSADAMRVFSGVLVIMADFRPDIDAIEYTGFCPAFVPVPPGIVTPEYGVEIHEDSIRFRPHVSYEQRKIKELRARIAELDRQLLLVGDRQVVSGSKVLTAAEVDEARRRYPSPAGFALKRLGDLANPAVGGAVAHNSTEDARHESHERWLRAPQVDLCETGGAAVDEPVLVLVEWPNAEPDWKPTPGDYNATPPRR